MNITEGLIVGLSGLRKNKMRSLLTMLGIIIGISGVVGIVSVGSGAKALVIGELERIGASNMIVVWRRERIRKGGQWERVRSTEYLRIEDAAAIEANCPSVESVLPELSGLGVQLRYKDKDKNSTADGTIPVYQSIRHWFVRDGRFISQEDVDTTAKVCVIGFKVWEDLCDKKGSIVGDEMRINGTRFTIIGVMEEKGDSMASQGWDDRVIVPLTTAQKRLISIGDIIGSLFIQAKSFEVVEKAEKEIMRVLEWRHEGAREVFESFTAKKAVQDVDKVSGIIKGLLGGVASISLVVGGIGIMNIMLVSVTERTWEIGLRKAVGAKRRDVLLQFLIESAVISVAGGIIGILIGVFVGIGGAKLFSMFIAKGTDWPSVVSIQSIIIATSVSFAIGIIFGIYPANRAAKLMPTEALRQK